MYYLISFLTNYVFDGSSMTKNDYFDFQSLKGKSGYHNCIFTCIEIIAFEKGFDLNDQTW